MIVDDELLACELIANLIRSFKLPLRVAGYAHSGDDALALIHSQRPDIVFLDVELPIHSGIDVMRKLRDEYSGSPKIIIITAHNFFEYAQQALRLGAKDLLLKPVGATQFLDMIGRVMGVRFTDNEMFNEVLGEISANYVESLSLTGCAKTFHVSPNYLARLFMKHTGMTFSAYVNRLRLDNAASMLREGDLSIKEIAALSGFNNLNYFYKKFHQYKGCTPKQYRG